MPEPVCRMDSFFGLVQDLREPRNVHIRPFRSDLHPDVQFARKLRVPRFSMFGRNSDLTGVTFWLPVRHLSKASLASDETWGHSGESGLTCLSGRCLSSYLLFPPVPVTSELRANLAQGCASARREDPVYLLSHH